MATRVRSFSKINLGLRIGRVREDGYHGLATVYQTLALHDVVTVEARRSEQTRIGLRADHPWVPVDGRNTAWKMVERALEAMGISAEVEIGIEKRLPVQGGMGAGSANAAAALLGLERELGIEGGRGEGLAGVERLRVAAAVGSDVPLFLVGGSVLGLGRGEQVVALPDLVRGGAGMPCVVAVPRVGVSTPIAFREWDRRTELTDGFSPDMLEGLSLTCSAAYAAGGIKASGFEPSAERGVDALRGIVLAGSALLPLVSAGIENDFEQVVFGFYPSLREIKQRLLGAETAQPAVYAAMSGSGSALFGLYRTDEAAREAEARVRSFHGEFAVETRRTELLSRDRMWEETFF